MKNICTSSRGACKATWRSRWINWIASPASGGLAMTIILFLTLTSCGLFSGSTNSEGDFNMSDEDVNTITFKAGIGEEIYKAVPVTNEAALPITITSIILGNNLCGDFSLHQITNNSGKILRYSGDAMTPMVVAGSETVNLIIRFRPTECPHSDYVAILYLYYHDGTSRKRVTVNLKPILGEAVEGGGGDDLPLCEETPLDYTYTPLAELSGAIPESTTENEFFLRVDRMRGFIFNNYQPTYTGTDMDGVTGYVPTYIKITGTGDGNFILSQIEDCTRFLIPSADYDINFNGQTTILTTFDNYEGTSNTDGIVEVSGLGAHLKVSGLIGSLIKDDSNNRFAISLMTSLTTGITEPNEHVAQIILDEDELEIEEHPFIDTAEAGADDEGNPIYALKGETLANGKMTLVGVGTFHNDRGDFIGSNLAEDALFNGTARIFMRLDVTMMVRDEVAE